MTVYVLNENNKKKKVGRSKHDHGTVICDPGEVTIYGNRTRKHKDSREVCNIYYWDMTVYRCSKRSRKELSVSWGAPQQAKPI